jgi:glycosyltransferase involved in cell wall biosynthesis
MDAFALTSRLEGLPLAVLEAWAAGLAVVASAVAGVPDLIEDGRNGFLFPFGDEAQLVALLGAVFGDRARAEARGAAGRETVFANYDLRRMAADYEALYRAARSTKGPATGRALPPHPAACPPGSV